MEHIDCVICMVGGNFLMKKENILCWKLYEWEWSSASRFIKKIPKDGVRGLWTYWNQREEKSKKDI